MRKKNMIGVLAIAAMVLCLAGCGGSEGADNKNTKESTVQTQAAEPEPTQQTDDRSDFEIACDMLGEPMSDLIAIIGEAEFVDHADSCLVSGEQDGYYQYDGFYVVTLSEDGVDFVYSVDQD